MRRCLRACACRKPTARSSIRWKSRRCTCSAAKAPANRFRRSGRRPLRARRGPVRLWTTCASAPTKMRSGPRRASEPQPPEVRGTKPPASPSCATRGCSTSRESKQYEEEATPSWQQVIGPRDTRPGWRSNCFPKMSSTRSPPNPGAPTRGSRWRAWKKPRRKRRDTRSPIAHATLALLSADGEVLDELELPGAKGAGRTRVVCPAVHDCWVATSAGWLFHLATGEEREHAQANGDPAFSGAYVVTYRPPDEGVPLQTSTTLPVDDSGLTESRSGEEGVRVEPIAEEQFARVSLPLLSHEHTRLRTRDRARTQLPPRGQGARAAACRASSQRGRRAPTATHAECRQPQPAAAPEHASTGRPSSTCRQMRSARCQRRRPVKTTRDEHRHILAAFPDTRTLAARGCWIRVLP